MDSFTDQYDRVMWPEVPDIYAEKCAGTPQFNMGPYSHTCPLSATPTKGELETQCCRSCIVAKSGNCAGYNGVSPVPIRGAKITRPFID